MKKARSFIILLVGILLIAAAISGTVAYLTSQAPASNNIFLGTVIAGEITSDSVTDMAVKNTSSTTGGIPVYARVAVTVNYTFTLDDKVYYSAEPPSTEQVMYRNGKIRDADYSFSINEDDWIVGGDGYYYCKKPLAVGETSGKLFESFTIYHPSLTWEGREYYLTVESACEVIQCENADRLTSGNQPAVVEAWGVTLAGEVGSEIQSVKDADFDPYA